MKKIGLILLLTGVLYAAYYSANHPIDFPLYYQATQQVLNNDFNIYPQGDQHVGHCFNYVPLFILLFLPFAILNLKVAAFLWFLLKIVSLVSLVWIILDWWGVGRENFWKVFGISFLVAGGYLIEEFRGGNVHFLILFLCVLAFYLMKKGQTIFPSLLLGTAISIKVFPLLFVGYFALKKQFKICFFIFLSLIALNLLPSLYFGHEANKKLLTEWVHLAKVKGTRDFGGYSLKGTLFRYLKWNENQKKKSPRVNFTDLPRGQVIAIWQIITALLLVFAAVVLAAKAGEGRDLLDYGFLVAAVVILTPHVQRIYFSTLFFPACIMAACMFKYPQNPYNRFIKFILGLCFFLNTLGPAIMPGKKAALAYQAHAPYFFSCLILFFALSFLIYKFEPTKGVKRTSEE